MNLKVKQTFLNDVHELIHGSGTTIARGDEQTVLKLKSVLEELISNERILSIINQYHKLKDRVDNDNNIEYLRDFADKLYYDIQGGELLAGFGSCERCIPDELSDVEIKQ